MIAGGSAAVRARRSRRARATRPPGPFGGSSRRWPRTSARRRSSTTSSGRSRPSSTSSSTSPTGLTTRPILLVCLARPEFLDERPGWGGGKLNATSMLLEPPDGRRVDRARGQSPGPCAARRAGRRRGSWTLPRATRCSSRKCSGCSIDDGLLRNDGNWVPTADLSQITVPPTIQALLSARLDRRRVVLLSVHQEQSKLGSLLKYSRTPSCSYSSDLIDRIIKIQPRPACSDRFQYPTSASILRSLFLAIV